MKLGELLLLLAVAASQVDPVYLSSQPPGIHDISSCAITFYGKSFSFVDVQYDPELKMCFKTARNDTSDNCLTVLNVTGGELDIFSAPSNTTVGSDLHNNLPSITETSPCNVIVYFMSSARSTLAMFRLYQFPKQSAVELKTYTNFPLENFTLAATVGGETVGTWNWTKAGSTSPVFMDLSSCRTNDGVVLPVNGSLAENCTLLMCDQYSNMTSGSACGADEFCQINRCQKKARFMCTVSGFTVIDFFDRVHSVPDRCDYTLMRRRLPSFHLVATFQERRRKDVPFLDYLKLSVGHEEIYLEQGGRVSVRGRVLELNSTAQSFFGVEFSKDLTGVTAKFHELKISFDGNTAHMMALDGAPVEGLCGNTTDSTWTTSPLQQQDSGANRCNVQHNDTVDGTIDCPGSTERCELMRHGPFTACHAQVDPEPYITACTNTSCKYPAKDGVHCQLFEAYAKSCSLRNVTLSGWRSNVSCSVPAASCLDHHCSSHEFCGERYGELRCFCRALFASPHKARNSFGENTVCTQNSATVTLFGCLLEDQGVNHTMLHLKDKNCKGVWDEMDHVVTFSFNGTDTCGTVVETNNTEIIYKNSIMAVNSTASNVITRHGQFRVDFSCYYAKPAVKSVSFRIRNSTVVQKIVSGIWNYTLMMNAYTDPGRTALVGPSTELDLDQKIWVELKTEDLDDSMVAIVTRSCWATASPPSNSTPRYDLVMSGCANAADGTVKVVGNGAGTSNYFSFNMFQFSGEDANLYLHCEVDLCPIQSRSCTLNCGGARRRRSFTGRFVDAEPALITMAWAH